MRPLIQALVKHTSAAGASSLQTAVDGEMWPTGYDKSRTPERLAADAQDNGDPNGDAKFEGESSGVGCQEASFS